VGRGLVEWPLIGLFWGSGVRGQGNAVHTEGVPEAVVLKCGWLLLPSWRTARRLAAGPWLRLGAFLPEVDADAAQAQRSGE